MPIKYTRKEERANSISHSLGIILVLAACIYFLSQPSIRTDTLSVLGFILYAFGGMSSYLASTIYHASPMQSKIREKLRKWDHAAIYWHIAGSYSPITLAFMAERQECGWGLFIIVWLCALIGSISSFRGLKEHSNVETICFVCMGLLVLLTFKPVLDCIGWTAMSFIIAEGVAFITGAVFYSFNKIRYMHTVFHIFVLLGSVFHITALYYMI